MNTNTTDLLHMTPEQQRLAIVQALRRRGDTLGLDAPIPFFSYNEQGKVMVSYGHTGAFSCASSAIAAALEIVQTRKPESL